MNTCLKAASQNQPLELRLICGSKFKQKQVIQSLAALLTNKKLSHGIKLEQINIKTIHKKFSYLKIESLLF